MRLLVSVRSAAEVSAAVQGGAEIVDAKEPSRGSLGAVSPEVLREIARALPERMPFSIALGDPAEPAAAAEQVAGALAAAVPRTGPVYLKLGLARAGRTAGKVLSAAVQAAAPRARVIVAAYADHEAASSPSPDFALRLAVETGAHGVLLDTWGKDGRTLFDHLPAAVLRAWIDRCRRHELLVALAGSLGLEGVARAAALVPDVVGVRGAACGGGREGLVEPERVGRLRAALRGAEADLQVVDFS